MSHSYMAKSLRILAACSFISTYAFAAKDHSFANLTSYLVENIKQALLDYDQMGIDLRTIDDFSKVLDSEVMGGLEQTLNSPRSQAIYQNYASTFIPQLREDLAQAIFHFQNQMPVFSTLEGTVENLLSSYTEELQTDVLDALDQNCLERFKAGCSTVLK